MAVEELRRLHEAQAAFYGGGPSEPLKDLLTPDVVWRVPGDSPIAGVYQGADAVVEYFTRRRDIASGTFTMHPVDVLVGAGEHVAALTDGTVIVEGITRKWSTVGLYRFRAERVAACWLLPLDPREFDIIWTACFRASSEPPPGRGAVVKQFGSANSSVASETSHDESAAERRRGFHRQGMGRQGGERKASS